MALTSNEQYLLELINRARLNPVAEAVRYGLSDLNRGLAPGTLSTASLPVLAPNTLLTVAADLHTQWMLDADQFSHTGAGGTTPGARMAAAGYSFTGSWSWGENIAWAGQSANLDFDAQIEIHHRGLFLSDGHRANLLNAGFREIGLSQLAGDFVDDQGQHWQSSMLTEDFALSGPSVFLTGVVYSDGNGDDFYTVGEGQGGVPVSVSGGAAVVSEAAGGYALATAAGVLDASIGGFQVRLDLSAGNAKLDLVDGARLRTSVSTTLLTPVVAVELLGTANLTLTGSAAGDHLTGNTGHNRLNGGAGPDLLEGADGNDTLDGGEGNDTLTGGAGDDTVVLPGSRAGYSVVYAAALQRFTLSSQASGLDDVSSVEFFQFADGLVAAADLIPPADTTRPTVAMTDDRDGVTNGVIHYTLVFSEPVSGLGVDDFRVQGGTVTGVSGSDGVYTVTVVPDAGFVGNLLFELNGDAVQDEAGNTNLVAQAADQGVDTVAPTVSITDNVPGVVNRSTGTIAYTLLFSEAVTGLDASDFTVSNATVGAVAGSGTQWTVSVTPTLGVSSGTIGLTLKAGAVSDAAGNTNALTSNSAQSIDTSAPVPPLIVTGDSINTWYAPVVTMDTTLGSFTVAVLPNFAPITAANFLGYVNSGFYDNTLFHRVISGFMAQGGGFTTGMVYRAPIYSPIPLESDNGLSNKREWISMARTNDPNSATSQFFINVVNNTSLDYKSAASPGYAAFGLVTSGMSVVDAIVEVQTTGATGSPADKPLTDVVITDARQTSWGGAYARAATLQLAALEAGSTWSYTLNGGTSWTTGTGTSFTVPVGQYAGGSIRVKTLDAAGNETQALYTSILTVETVAPTLASRVPADNTSQVSRTANLSLTFSESVMRGAGSITLRDAAGTAVETFDVAASTRLSFSGSVVTIDPTADLAVGTRYYLEVSTGAVTDLAGNAYAGLSGASAWNFTTVGVTGGTNGTNGNDSLQGTAGPDILTPGLGNDTVDGGAGQDTAALPLFPNVFSLSAGSSAGSASGSYRAGSDTFSLDLTGIELVRFGSTFQTTVPLAELTSGRAQDSLAKLTDLYLAFFGRAPDVGGLEYWQEILLESGRDFATISADFAWSTEAQALFPQGGSNRDFVRAVYLNCFGREPDQAGWDWWTDRLNALNPNDPQYLNNRGSFVGEVILGAYAPTSGAEDRNLLTNRHEVAMDYANRLVVQPGEGFDAAINDLLERVTGDAATRTGATAVLQHVFDHPVTLTGVMGDAALLASLWGG
jgi:cyclophilin family peptidyl-prolyl cis-trans isomerase/Ca2+-binding RTX toxin-like protein/methionine-rich copper-binding protein CopC